MRLKCGNLNAHLYSLHVIDDATCICGNVVEDCKHFFFQCPYYVAQRIILVNDLHDLCDFKLHHILYGDDNLDIILTRLCLQLSRK